MRTLILSLLLLPAALASAADFAVAPAPAWVERADVREAARVKPSEARSGIYAVLTDHQARVADANVTDYYRRVRTVLTSAGVQNASELSIDFDPSYERLVIHDVAVVRGEERIDELDATGIRVIEKESDQEERIYDGQLTALLFLKDVRPGDVIDYAYSLEGANPLLGGKYADELELSSSLASGWIRHRLLWPANRPLHHRSTIKTLQPKIEHRGAYDAYTWERHDVAAVDDEDETPSWFDPYETVQVTEFESWNEVARWASALFKADDVSRAEVAKLAARIASENKSDEARITAAIRFVQDDIRYLGIEMGRNSHEPHQPSETLAKRFGDCKDKTFLLCLLLREFGLEAHPAMVNTKLRHRLDDFLPSPFVFDHVIAEVVAGGKTHWIDGTISDQGGRLATIETPNDERALIVRDDTVSLARIATHARGAVAIAQTYEVGDDGAPSTMTVRATYSGHEADDLRARLATSSASDLAKDHLNRYAADQPNIESLGAPDIRDDRDANVITVSERYRVRDLLSNGRFTYTPRAVEQFLKRPQTMIRKTPLAFDYPLDVTQTATFNLGKRVASSSTDDSRELPAFHFERHVESSGRRVSLTYRLRARRDTVEVADVPRHLTALNDVSEHLGYTVEPQGTLLAATADWSWGFTLIVLLVGACTWIAGRITR